MVLDNSHSHTHTHSLTLTHGLTYIHTHTDIKFIPKRIYFLMNVPILKYIILKYWKRK